MDINGAVAFDRTLFQIINGFVLTEALEVSEDGSAEVVFGRELPKGVPEANFVPTVPAAVLFPIFASTDRVKTCSPTSTNGPRSKISRGNPPAEFACHKRANGCSFRCVAFPWKTAHARLDLFFSIAFRIFCACVLFVAYPAAPRPFLPADQVIGSGLANLWGANAARIDAA